MNQVCLEVVPAAAVVDLRYRILRAGLPREAAIFPGDDAPDTLHFGAIAEGAVICCLTLLQTQWDTKPAWQLRGMATDTNHQGTGIGSKLMQFAIDHVRLLRPDITTIWCNARVCAIGFYRKGGWQVVSDQFEIPTAGPHVKMTRPI